MDSISLYAKFLRKFFLKLTSPPSAPIGGGGLKVVFDCSNGTAGIVLKELFLNFQFPSSNFQLRSILINNRPDGNFPAHGPNPMAEGAMDDLKKAVLRNRADLGVIFDADGDRVFFVDDRGRAVHPDIAAALISKNFRGPVILDVRAGYLARELIGEKRIIESRVGHYFIKKLMRFDKVYRKRRKKIEFAAEVSGHYYFSFPKWDAGWDSGILAAIFFMNKELRIMNPAHKQVMCGMNHGTRLSAWIDTLPKYYRSGELNFQIIGANNAKKMRMTRIENYYKKQAKEISHLDGLTMIFNDWWFNLRPSNTEDLLRLNLEAKQEKIFKKALKEISALAS